MDWEKLFSDRISIESLKSLDQKQDLRSLTTVSVVSPTLGLKSLKKPVLEYGTLRQFMYSSIYMYN